MTEFIGEIFSIIFNGNVVLATIMVSMIPIMELKGGIPFGMSEAFWGAKALTRWQAFWYAYIGCSMVAIGLYFAFVPIMKFLRKTKIFKGLAKFIDDRVKTQSKKYEDGDCSADVDNNVNMQNVEVRYNKKHLLKILGVFCFVAIPLPLTGVWMGVCVAVVIGLNFWETLISVLLGNLVAGLIISTICVIFPQFTHWLIYGFIILVAMVIIFELIKSKIAKKSKNN